MWNREKLALVSPVFVILLGQFCIRLFADRCGNWAWLPFCLFYWALIGGLTWLLGGWLSIRRWLQPARGKRWWLALSILFPVALTFPILLPNRHLLLSAPALLGTALFVLLNPSLEELYWRGLLLDVNPKWPRWVSASYSLFFFTLHHAWLGVISPAGRHSSAFVGTILMGMLWMFLRFTTNSLRWPILSHFLVNLLGLSVPVFLGLYVP
jgi:membrane protease YdiL (CAAX protease family)